MKSNSIDYFFKINTFNAEIRYNFILNKINSYEDLEDYEQELWDIIEIFNLTIQFVEEFLLYLFAYIKRETDKSFSEILVQTNIRNLKEFIKKINSHSYDLLRNKDFKNFDDFLIFAFDLKGSEVLYLDNIKKSLIFILNFFHYYLDLNNSIKHGYRIFPFHSDYIIFDSNEKFFLDEEYFIAVMKNHLGKPILHLIPLNTLYLDTKNVLISVKELFSFLIKKINSERGVMKFTHNPKNLIFKYELYKGSLCFVGTNKEILSYDFVEDSFKYENVSIKIDKKNNLWLKLSNNDNFIENPFCINAIIKDNHSLAMSKELDSLDLSLNSNYRLSINQVNELLKLKRLNESNNINSVKIFNGEEILFENCDCYFNKFDFDFNEEIIKILKKIERMTNLIIEYPFLSKEIEEELLLYGNKINNQKEAYDVLNKFNIAYLPKN